MEVKIGFFEKVREELRFEGQGKRKHLSERNVQEVFHRAIISSRIKKPISVHLLTT